jgi:mRNA interferase HigB
MSGMEAAFTRKGASVLGACGRLNIGRYECKPRTWNRGMTTTSPNAKILCAGHQPEWADSLAVLYKIAKAAQRKHFAHVRQRWKNSDSVGTCVVFDIANNRCRLIAYIRYDYDKVFIPHILSHADYVQATRAVVRESIGL